MEIRFNEVKIGDVFKRTENSFGTTTFKRVGDIYRSSAYKNEYKMWVEVISTTKERGYYSELIGKKIIITSVIKYGRLGKVKLVNKV